MDTSRFINLQSLATHEYYAHVLQLYNDEELKALMKVCKHARIGGSASQCATYKEVQIHGPIDLATDIQALSLPGKEEEASSEVQQLVGAFQKKTQCNILWQEDILNRY